MRIKRKVISILISLVMLINVPLCGFYTVYADESITNYDPALIPIFTTVASVAVALGLQARNGADALNELVNNAISEIKYSEVLKATSDNTYNSPYRVVGSNGEPEKPNNNNKNGKWFALAGASALTGAVLGEKGMVEDIASTLNNLNAFKPMQGSIGVMTADKFKNQGSASQIALQLADYGNACVTQFDTFLHSDYWNDKSFTPNDCVFAVNVCLPDLLQLQPKYPRMCIRIFPDLSLVKNIDVTSAFSQYTFTNSYGSYTYTYVSTTSSAISFLNADNIAVNVPIYTVNIRNRLANEDLRIAESTNTTNSRTSLSPYLESQPMLSQYAYMGYKWISPTEWGFTQNVYNSNQTIINQYPDWTNETIGLLGQQIDALRIGIQNLNNPWQPTQPEIQTSPSPEAVISQLLNNWLNPENAPDPNPDPDPDPDPDPNPDPEPAPEPIHESALNEAGEDIFDWVQTKLVLPDGIFDKIPFSIPYDFYLILRSMFPTNSGRSLLRVNNGGATIVQDPNNLTISTNFEAGGKQTRTYSENVWEKTAPTINLDLHFQYHDTQGQIKTIDIVKTVDLKPYSYFAMILYIILYITWLFTILSWISSSFK